MPQMLLHQSRPGYVFDPRTRPWFQLARGNDRPVLTEPYVFFTTREVGTTLAREAYQVPEEVPFGGTTLVPLAAGEALAWRARA